MPVYEYRCTQCQKIFEYQQRMADAPRTECEECKGALERLISRSSFSFKGGGWYKDLYASAKPEAAATPTPSTPSAAPAPSSDGGSSSTATPAPSTPSAAPSTGGGTGGGGSGTGSGSSSGSTSSSAA